MRCVVLLLLVLIALKINAQPLEVDISSDKAILINSDTGQVLFEKNSTKTGYPASITKVATAIYALSLFTENLENEIVAEQEAVASISPQAKRKGSYKNPPWWIETGATHIGIKKGESIRLRDLFYAILVASANDAVNIVAQHYGSGSIETFMKGLNQYLNSIGCIDTNFLNPHGLHHPDHKTTPRDMALIAREALKNSFFREIVSTKIYTIPKTNKQPSRTIVQTNQLLKKSPYTYEFASGIKTGYTSDAGHNLVASAKKEGRNLLAVVMNGSERKEVYKDIISLFDTAFLEEKVHQKILNKGSQKYKLSIKGASSPLTTYINEDIVYSFYPSEEREISISIEWKNSLTLPIKAGSEVGFIKLVSKQGELIASSSLYSMTMVKPTLIHKIKLYFSTWTKIEVAILSFFIIMSGYLILFLRKRKNLKNLQNF